MHLLPFAHRFLRSCIPGLVHKAPRHLCDWFILMFAFYLQRMALLSFRIRYWFARECKEHKEDESWCKYMAWGKGRHNIFMLFWKCLFSLTACLPVPANELIDWFLLNFHITCTRPLKALYTNPPKVQKEYLNGTEEQSKPFYLVPWW